MAAALFIFVLLASFNRTVNRLTKPVSAIIALSLLSSCFISSFYYFKKIEGDLLLSDFFKSLRKQNFKQWHSIQTEDLNIIEGMQEGRNSPVYNGGNFSPVLDNPTHHFNKWVATSLIDNDFSKN